MIHCLPSHSRFVLLDSMLALSSSRDSREDSRLPSHASRHKRTQDIESRSRGERRVKRANICWMQTPTRNQIRDSLLLSLLHPSLVRRKRSKGHRIPLSLSLSRVSSLVGYRSRIASALSSGYSATTEAAAAAAAGVSVCVASSSESRS